MFNNIIPDSAEIVVSTTQPSNANNAMMWYNPDSNQISIYNNGVWNSVTAGNAAVNRYIYTVGTASGDYDGTSFDTFEATYSVGTTYGALEVYVNGVHLTQGVDFTSTTGTEIVLTSAASTNDEIVIVAWGDVQQTVVATDYDDTDVQTYLTNNSYATETYVNTAVANVVDAAPASLDTLNELAAALNDDANYAATITASLATKLNTTDFDTTFDTRLALKTTADLAEATVDGKYMTDAERVKLSGIETSATADQTGAEIKALYEAEADTNAYTDANLATVNSVENGAINSASVRTLIEGTDLDMGTNKILYSNVYSQTTDLPSATSYHGMFAHVHATGRAYYAHAGAWIEMANASDLTTGLALLYATGSTAAVATGTHSSAFGEAANASGDGSIALSKNADADGENSVAIGNAAQTVNAEGIAIGSDSEVIGDNGVAIGHDTSATTDSVALGASASATHANSVALGHDAATTAANQVVLGGGNVDAVVIGDTGYTPTADNHVPTKKYVDDKTPQVFSQTLSTTVKTSVAALGTTTDPRAMEVVVTAASGGEIEMTKFLCVIDSNFDVHFTEFGEVFSGNSLYTADIIDASGTSGELEIFVTSASSALTDYTVTVINR